MEFLGYIFCIDFSRGCAVDMEVEHPFNIDISSGLDRKSVISGLEIFMSKINRNSYL